MEINVKADIKAATSYLNNVQRKQIPYATSRALNETAFQAQREVKRQMPIKLDRPTPFTLAGVQVEKSTKQKLISRVLIAPNRWKYMRFQVVGGIRTPNRRAISMPVGAKLNKYGNMSKGAIARLLARPDTFSGTINGVGGIWQRGHISKAGRFSTSKKSRSTSVRLLVAWEDQATYQANRFPFHKIGTGMARSKFRRNFERSLAAALRSAK